MKELDRRGRITLRLIIAGLLVTIDLAILLPCLFGLVEPVTDSVELYFCIAVIVLFNIGFLCALFFACRSTPRVYFSDEGVYIQPFFQKKLYPWDDILQAIVLGRRLRSLYFREPMYEYHFFLLTKDGSPWIPGDTRKTYLKRNRKHLLLIPLTNENKEYVKRHRVKMTFDESHGKKIYRRVIQ